MASPQVRLSTLAEIKVLSLESIRNFNVIDGTPRETPLPIDQALDALSSYVTLNDINLPTAASVFKTVGIARSVRIDEDYGTQNLYAIGSPTRPRIIPNNYNVSVTAERIQLDTRNLYDYMATPEYFYSPDAQAFSGVRDSLYYTYMFVRNKETGEDNLKYDIYALMPRTSTKTISNGDVMISHNVSLTGFKVNYGDSGLKDFLNNVVYELTGDL